MKFLFISHGAFAESIVGSAQMIVGEQTDFKTLGLYPEDDIEALKEKVRIIFENYKGEEILCFSDLFSGSPFNAIVEAMRDYQVQHITGMNLPIVLEAFMLRQNTDITVDDIRKKLISMASNTIIDVREFLEESE